MPPYARVERVTLQWYWPKLVLVLRDHQSLWLAHDMTWQLTDSDTNDYCASTCRNDTLWNRLDAVTLRMLRGYVVTQSSQELRRTYTSLLLWTHSGPMLWTHSSPSAATKTRNARHRRTLIRRLVRKNAGLVAATVGSEALLKQFSYAYASPSANVLGVHTRWS
jgi:hypothetical protein